MFDFSQLRQAPYGIKTEYTFYQDFQIADMVGGKSGVQDTFRRVQHWKTDPTAWGEVVCALNWRLWDLYKTDEGMARLYEKLCGEAKDTGYKLGADDKDYARVFYKVID